MQSTRLDSDDDNSGSQGSSPRIPFTPNTSNSGSGSETLHYTFNNYNFKNDLDKILKAQRKGIGLRIGKSLYVTFTDAPTWLNAGGDKADHATTYTRSFQVYSNLWVNFSSSPAENDASLYYQLLHVNGQGSVPTDLGWAFFGLGLIAFPSGMIIEAYRAYRKKYVTSEHYQKKRLQDIGYVIGDDFRDQIEESYRNFLARGKVRNRLVHESKKLKKPNRKEQNLSRIIGFFGDKFHVSESNLLRDFFGAEYDVSEKKFDRYWFERSIATAGLIIKRIWSYLNDQAYIYWLVWFPFVSVIGISAASASAFFAPIVISITLALGGLYALPKMIKWIQDAKKTPQDIADEEAKKARKAERTRMNAELRYRHFIKTEHALNRAMLQELGIVEKHNVQPFISKKTKVLKKQAVLDSKLGQFLLKGTTLRIGINVAIDAVNAVVMTSFIFWVISAVIFSFGGAIPAFIFFDSMFNSGVAGLLIAFVSGLKKYLDMKKELVNYEDHVYEKLAEINEKTGESKLECFERLEREVEFGKGKAEWERLQVLMANSRLLGPAADGPLKAVVEKYRHYFNREVNIKVTPEKYKLLYNDLSAERRKLERQFPVSNDLNNKLAKNYDLEKIDVYDHEYRDKLRHKENVGYWTMTKRVLNRIYTVLAGAQTGSLLARSLFIAGCIGGGIATTIASGGLAFAIFTGIAAGCAIGYAAICLAKYQVERDCRNRKNFLENIDGHISYLKKKTKELDMLSQHLSGSAKPDVRQDITRDEPVRLENGIDGTEFSKRKKTTHGTKCSSTMYPNNGKNDNSIHPVHQEQRSRSVSPSRL